MCLSLEIGEIFLLCLRVHGCLKSECQWERLGNNLCAGLIDKHNGIFGLKAIHRRLPGNTKVHQGVIYSSVTVGLQVNSGLYVWSFL